MIPFLILLLLKKKNVQKHLNRNFNFADKVITVKKKSNLPMKPYVVHYTNVCLMKDLHYSSTRYFSYGTLHGRPH